MLVTGLPLGSAAGAAEGSVVINELHYHPPTDGLDFVELHNPGGAAVDLGGACFTAGIGGCFAEGTTLPPGGYVVAAEVPADHATAFPGAPAPALDFTGGLSNGGETVTLSDGDTVLDTVTYSDSSPWPASPDGDGPSLELIDPEGDNDVAAAWAASDPAPTPGARNTRFGQGPTPVIGAVEVGTVTAGQPITVTAAVTGATSVQLEVVVRFGPPTTIAMVDAGDGTYEATIPAQAANTLVRYRVRATAGDVTATVPDAGDSRPRLGFVVAPPAPPTALPLLQWFIAPADLATLMANIETNDYVPAVIAYGTEVWDGVEVRGQGNSRHYPKVNFKFKMPGDHPLVAPEIVADPVDEFVLDGDRRDPMGTTGVVGFDVYAESNPYVPQRAKVRVHRNGNHFGLFTLLEEWEDPLLARTGLDQPGAEVYEPEDEDGIFVDEGSPEALVPRFEKLAGPGDSYARLYALVQAIDAPPTAARTARLRDLFDVPALVEFLATGAVLQHWDQTVHNFLVVRDPATGRWRFAPSDMDFTMGMPSRPAPTLGFRTGNVFPFGPADLVSALRTDPLFAEMYFRRVRTLAERLLTGGELEDRTDALYALVEPDAEADRARYGHVETPAQGRAQLADFVADRATELLVTRRRAGEVPAAPTAGLPVVVSEIAYAAAGGPGHDLVELHNPANEAIDLSGWTLGGAATATLPPGTVLPAGGFLVVPGDQEATAGARPSGTLVAGELAAGVADGGGTVTVRDAGGATRGQAAYGTTAPWPTAPAAGTATLERTDPATAGTGPSAWRASATAAGSPGGAGHPAGPPPAHRLAVEAAADQVEVRPGDGSRVGFTVVVTNTGHAPRPGVTVAAPGATCPGRIGTLAAGARLTLRCRSQGQATPDRTYLFTATSGSVTARSAPVPVRTLTHTTQYVEQHLPAAPTAPEATAPGQGRIGLRWTPPAGSAVAPHRWVVITECAPGAAVPTGGTLRAPGASASLDHLPLDQPVQLAVAVRNQAGTGPRTPPTPELTPRTSPVFPFADTPSLVRRFVAGVEGRPATDTEVALWSAVIDQGTSPAHIVASALGTPRWSRDVAPVARLYTAYFGRLPDQAGLGWWVARRRAGTGLDPMSSAFAGTPEFRAMYGSLSDGAFVSQLYRNVFGREADAAGRAYWVDRMARGMARGRVVTSFSESAEGRLLLAPMVQTSLVWTALTGTTPSPAVARPAVDWLAGGGSLLTVVEGVRTSDRYAALVG
ncbi:MAG TPA: CotH kinase family protein [Iamia sp.]|nr:CotH kinase family protein [Iamia sp.]